MKRQNNAYRLKAVRTEEGCHVLKQAEHCYVSFEPARKMIRRCKNYAYGKQLEDMVPDGDGGYMKEKDLLEQRGGSTLTQNMIRHQVNVLVGSFLNMNSEPIAKARDRAEQTFAESLTELLKYVNDINYAQGFYSKCFEEYVVGAASVTRQSYGEREGAIDTLDCLVTKVNIDDFFVDTDMEDFRGWDGNLVGQIHELQWGDLCGMLCRNSRDEETLKQVFHVSNPRALTLGTLREFGGKKFKGDFYHTGDLAKFRVIEVWQRKRKYVKRYLDKLTGDPFVCEPKDVASLVDAVNAQRQAEWLSKGVAQSEIDDNLIEELEETSYPYWHFYFFAPDGTILIEGDSPYLHGSHPYVFSFYPFTFGELHPFIEDAIDIQRNLNQMMRLNKFLLETGAKNLLLVPKSVTAGKSLEEIEHVWASPAGVFIYDDKNGQNPNIPQQVTTAATNVGVSQLIQVERQFLQDVTGVSDALQGNQAGSISGSYYAQMAANAAVGIQSLITAYSVFMKMNAQKACYNIQQYYSEERIVEILGLDKANTYIAKRVKDLMFDVNISESHSSPVYRQLANEWLMGLFQAGQISLKTLIEAGDFPYGDKVLQLTEQEKREQQEAAMMGQQMQAQSQGGSMAGLEQIDTLNQPGATPVPSTLTNPINPVTREEQSAARR